jgi:hypothetical protein
MLRRRVVLWWARAFEFRLRKETAGVRRMKDGLIWIGLIAVFVLLG